MCTYTSVNNLFEIVNLLAFLASLALYLRCSYAVKFLTKTESRTALGLNGYMPVAFAVAMQSDGVRDTHNTHTHTAFEVKAEFIFPTVHTHILHLRGLKPPKMKTLKPLTGKNNCFLK